jgi:hypothetical protein
MSTPTIIANTISNVMASVMPMIGKKTKSTMTAKTTISTIAMQPSTSLMIGFVTSLLFMIICIIETPDDNILSSNHVYEELDSSTFLTGII